MLWRGGHGRWVALAAAAYTHVVPSVGEKGKEMSGGRRGEGRGAARRDAPKVVGGTMGLCTAVAGSEWLCGSGRQQDLHPVAGAEAGLGVGRVAGEGEARGGRPPVCRECGGEELLVVGHAVVERERAGGREAEWLSRRGRKYAGEFILKRECGVELCMKGRELREKSGRGGRRKATDQDVGGEAGDVV